MHFAAPETCLVQAICSDAFSPLWAGVGNLAPPNKYLAMVVLAPTIKYQIPTTKYKIPTTKFKVQPSTTREVTLVAQQVLEAVLM